MKNVFLNLKIFLILLFSILFSGCFMKGEIRDGSKPLTSSEIEFDGIQTAYNVNGTSIQINWNLSTSKNIIEYNVYQVTDNSTLRLIGITNATTNLYVHSSLTSGKLYQYLVRAVSSSSITDDNNNIVSAIPYSGISTFNYESETSVNLIFPSAIDAGLIKIYCGTNGPTGEMNPIADVTPTLTTYQLTNLSSSLIYSCRVKLQLPNGTQDNNSLTLSFRPQSTSSSPLGFAGIKSASNIDGSQALITWDAAQPIAGYSISGYRIYQTNPDNSMSIYDISSLATNYTVSNLLVDESYSFNVRAINASDQSTDGNQVILSAFMYEGITSSAVIDANSATLTFPQANNASSLNLYCYESLSPKPTSPSASLSNTATSYTISSLSASTDYKCFIKAVGPTGEDSNTKEVSFTTL